LKKTGFVIGIGIIIIALSGCGGGGGNSVVTPPAPEPPSVRVGFPQVIAATAGAESLVYFQAERIDGAVLVEFDFAYATNVVEFPETSTILVDGKNVVPSGIGGAANYATGTVITATLKPNASEGKAHFKYENSAGLAGSNAGLNFFAVGVIKPKAGTGGQTTYLTISNLVVRAKAAEGEPDLPLPATVINARVDIAPSPQE